LEDNQIVIGSFSGYGGYDIRAVHRVFQVGDVIMIEVANPQEQGLLSPSNPDFLGAPVGKVSVTVTQRTGG
jgi:hypothetical protein